MDTEFINTLISNFETADHDLRDLHCRHALLDKILDRLMSNNKKDNETKNIKIIEKVN